MLLRQTAVLVIMIVKVNEIPVCFHVTPLCIRADTAVILGQASALRARHSFLYDTIGTVSPQDSRHAHRI